MRIATVLYLLLLYQITYGGSLTKAYKKYKEKEYEEALALLKTELGGKGNCAELHYLYAMVLSEPMFPKHNYDSAYAVAWEGNECYELLDQKTKDKLYQKYSLSSAQYKALLHNISVDAFSELNKESKDSLLHFMRYYSNERVVKKAERLYDEITIFSSIPTDREVEFYEKLIEKYPDNEKINQVWQLFYNKYTADGEPLTYQKFILKYEKFPFDSLIETDFKLAKKAEFYELETRTDRPQQLYDDFIRLSAPSKKAFKVMRNLVSPYLKAKDWKTAIAIANKYEAYFKGSYEYEMFVQMLEQDDEMTAINPFPTSVNSEDWEYSPLISADNRHLYFCGKKRPDNIGGEDIFIADSTENGWDSIRIVDKVNTPYYNEAPEAISVDETMMLLFKEGDIYFTIQNEDGWSNLRKFPVINTHGWEGDAVLSADGRAILFASESGERANMQYFYKNRSDRYDIFVSVLKDDTWSKPINLGETINTTFTDRYPYLHNDMKTLYFSSMGHGSLGETDVFMSRRLYDTSWVHWTKPVNLGKYINTAGYDNGYKITVSGDIAYFASHSNGQYDLYYINLPEKLRPEAVMLVEGVIRNTQGMALTAEVVVEDLSNGEILGTYKSIPSSGKFTFTVPKGKNIGYYVNKKFYYPYSNHVDLRDSIDKRRIYIEVVLESVKELLETGKPVIVNNIFFDTDKYDLLKESHPELDRIVKLMNDFDKIRLKVDGHTDNTGTEAYNQELSQKRAQSVMNYLNKKGIPTARISVEGFGSNKPISSNNTEEGKRANRRVEVRMEK